MQLTATLLVGGTALVLLAGPARSADPKSDAGRRPLFDGKTASGWRGFKKDAFPDHAWAVQDGCLAAIGGKDGHGSDIVTADTFTDFELRFTWRIAAGSNSGVKYLVTEERSGPIAHEYQIIDPAHADARNGPKRLTAAFYDVLPVPEKTVERPAGEMNESRVVVRGPHVEHWLNGSKTLEYELGSEALREAVAQSKFKAVAGFGDKIPGRVLLQHHGDPVWFCSIEIRDLTAAGK